MWLILFILSLIVIAILIIAFYVFFKKTEAKIEIYEMFISGIFESINKAFNVMKSADIRGAFEADDEVGEAFKVIKFEIDRLKNIMESGIEAEDAEKK